MGAAGATIRPEGLEAAILTKDGIAIWDLDPTGWMRAACQIASRNLTQQEWERYIGNLDEYHVTCPQFA